VPIPPLSQRLSAGEAPARHGGVRRVACQALQGNRAGSPNLSDSRPPGGSRSHSANAPFEPRVEGRSIFARGSCDNKGQNLAHFKAVEAYLKTGSELPCDVTFIIEGEEEVGSGSLEGFLRAHRKELACEAVVISDTGMPSPRHPALTYGLRGILACEVILRGPSRDLHSGIFGGTVDNPAIALCKLLAQLRGKNGKDAKPPAFR
jgi:acetylornithine deacetylase/succinyl-diaminopimelate desuccinylase-like protein